MLNVKTVVVQFVHTNKKTNNTFSIKHPTYNKTVKQVLNWST